MGCLMKQVVAKSQWECLHLKYVYACNLALWRLRQKRILDLRPALFVYTVRFFSQKYENYSRGNVANDCFSHCSAVDGLFDPNKMVNSRQRQRNGCPTMWLDWAPEKHQSLASYWNYCNEAFTFSIRTSWFWERMNALKKIRTSVEDDGTCL